MTGLAFLALSAQGWAQDKEDQLRTKESERYVRKAEAAKAKGDFAGAEADYRRALSKDSGNSRASYNFSHLYQDHEKDAEATRQLLESVKSAQTKALRHKAFHNLGNAFMDYEDYEQAVRAYKDALRNDPTDDETRYNLALAKEKLEKEQEGQDQDEDDESGGGEDDQQQDDNNSRDNKEQQDQDDNEDDEQDQQDQQQNQEGDDQDQNEDENQENQGQPDQEEGENDDDDEQDEDEGQEPREGQLSEEQIENLLRAAENLEKETQKKRDKQKAKEVKINPREKDW